MGEKRVDPHIRNIVDRFKDDRQDVSAVAVTVATFRVLRSALKGKIEPQRIAAIQAAVKAELPGADERQIDVVLRHYHRTGVIVFRNGVITRGPTFRNEADRMDDLE